MSVFRKRSPREPAAPRRRPSSGDMPGMRTTGMFSYHAHRSGSAANLGRLDNAAIEAANPAAQTRWYTAKWAVISGSVLVLVGLLALTNLSGQPRVTLQSNSTNIAFLQDKTVYSQAVQKYLLSSPLHQNKLTLSSADLANTIKHDYPEIKSVGVRKPLIGTSPGITLTPYDASYILTTGSASAMLLDENGHAMVPVGQIADAPGMGLVTIEDKTARSISLGAQALPRTTITFVNVVTAVLKSQHIPITSVSLPAGSSELDVNLPGRPYFAKLNLQGDARLQSGALVATVRQFEKDKVTPAQYIDVRVPGRVYYK